MEVAMLKNQLESKLVKMNLLAGKSKLTVVSIRTGKHITYKIKQKSENKLWWVSVLRHDDDGWYFIGTIYLADNGALTFKYSDKSKVSFDAPSVQGFRWLLHYIDNTDKLDTHVQVLHSGRCNKCGKELTNPESIQLGLGPHCSSYSKTF